MRWFGGTSGWRWGKRLAAGGLTAATAGAGAAMAFGGGDAIGDPASAALRAHVVDATQPSYVLAAEQVSQSFVAAYESYSYDDGPSALASRVSPYVTPELAQILGGPSQGGAGAALSAEKATATASAVDETVESATPTQVSLLVTASIQVTSSNGSSVQERYVPITLSLTDGTWKVADVDSLVETVAPGAPSTPVVATPPGSSGPAGSGGTTPPAPVLPVPAPPVSPTVPPTKPGGVPGHVKGIPDDFLSWYEEASTSCPGLSWTVLAAIGTEESDNGQSSLPGVHSGANYAGAEGPMQFEPATFAYYGMVAPGGASPASPYDPPDAIWSAARMLCADGAGRPGGLYGAVFAYNHSTTYVSDVLALASRYAAASGSDTTLASEVGLGWVIVKDVEAYLGTPYVWGGENPNVGFDCSGLVQWVYAKAGLNLPRVAQDQYNAGPHLPAGAELYAGDLVFFGTGPRGVEHVGIYVGHGQMVDAPHTGADVRVDDVVGFSPAYIGATRPEIPDVSASGPGLPVTTSYVGHPGNKGGAGQSPSGQDNAGDGPTPSHHRRHPTGTSGDTDATSTTDSTPTSQTHHHHRGSSTSTGDQTAPDSWMSPPPTLPWDAGSSTDDSGEPGSSTTSTSWPRHHRDGSSAPTTSTTSSTTDPSSDASTTSSTTSTSWPRRHSGSSTSTSSTTSSTTSSSTSTSTSSTTSSTTTTRASSSASSTTSTTWPRHHRDGSSSPTTSTTSSPSSTTSFSTSTTSRSGATTSTTSRPSGTSTTTTTVRSTASTTSTTVSCSSRHHRSSSSCPSSTSTASSSTTVPSGSGSSGGTGTSGR